LKPTGHPFDPYTVYRQFPTIFSLEIHHGGRLSKAPNRLYDGGKYWYKMPDKDILLQLSNDKDVLRFSKYVDRCKIMQLYVVHPVDKPKPLGDSEENSEESVTVTFDVEVEDRIEDVGQDEVFEDLDLEDFDSGSDPDDVDHNRKKALRMLARKHKPIDGNIYSENFYCGQTFPNKEMIKKMVSKISVVNRRQLWLTKNDKVRVRARCRGIVPTFSNEDGSQFGPNGPSGSSGRPHCDVLLNNMCEVLNRQLLDGRDKPIITCLEFIRQYLMKRIVIVQQLISKSNGPLTPNATKIFNNIKKEAAQITVLWNGGDLYQATGPHGTQYVCNMTQRTCSCKKWDLTGIPCKHAVACIWDMASNGQRTLVIPEIMGKM
ncbi:mutator type transposase, partial [Tanacetum coccineum]